MRNENELNYNCDETAEWILNITLVGIFLRKGWWSKCAI